MKPLYRHILLLLSVLCAVVLQFFVTLFTFNDVSSHPLPPPISQTPLLKLHHHLRLPQQQQQLKALPSPSSRSLLSLPPKPTTALVAALDGTMYLVDKQENSPTRVIWSFSTGSPIYHSYQAPIHKDSGKENGSTARISGSVECGDDWSLYMHDKHFGKMAIFIYVSSPDE
ncbi:hypothetical protein PIB30_005461 [Stylosanthes scabra]|uniref:Uncharacterized protein n=1 Tax=Stylosanthes scabra TaxID=79078 RepID=A0ABU6Y5R6_9FABA|nr:hypothetical protein [Stylosanthes scabra]